ncbi:MAG: MBL fold metallo-hydrolase [Candidatus Hydrogenedentes bacterium]|nr:MBL fold metallo-hydrolase [Candidatus Hydrogenedentota bacterium]
MKITSYGAAQEVTGSKHLVEINGHRILLDCGMFQGKRSESDLKNRSLPFAPNSLDAVIVSHSHVDHIGVLPMLSKYGYRKRIYSTPATRDLSSLMLLDSAHIQAKDAEWLSKKNRDFVAPLYTAEHASETMKLFVGIPYKDRFEVVPGVYATFHDAGHILGSAMVMLEFQDNGRQKRFLFGGDLGRRHMPILNDPWEPGDADVVMMESTYGNRDHDPIETMEDKLAEVIRATHARGGKIVIPSFALERAQELVYALKHLELRGAIPEIPVYVDSPLTVNITDVFRMHTECFDAEIRELMTNSGDPFRLKHIEYIRNANASIRLNSVKTPMIIISASGMCETGRILHHLRNNCEDERNTILIVGFQAKNTLGRRIVEREKEIKIFGVKRALNAQVKVMNAFSAHAGRSELIAFGKRFKDCAERLLLVHGEEEAITALQTSLQAVGANNIVVPEEGIPVTI